MTLTIDLLIVLLILAGVAAFFVRRARGPSYTDPAGPRYSGEPGPGGQAVTPERVIKIVTYNIEFARAIGGASRLLAADPGMQGADVVLLQEMTAEGARQIAEALGMWWVYYPAMQRANTGADFGNAVLARWPIVADTKLLLPYPSRYANTLRTATHAELRVGDVALHVYATHLGTPLDVSAASRRVQLEAILKDASRHDYAIVGGDLNDPRVGAAAVAAGWRWPTAEGPGTVRGLGRVDHVFVKGMETSASGTGPLARDVSDHRAVWVDVVLAGSTA